MLKIQFSTSSERVEDLKQDFENLKNDSGLPCEITPDFVTSSTPVFPNTVAVTFCEEPQVKQDFLKLKSILHIMI